MRMSIAAGDVVIARSWAGEFERRAVIGVEEGYDFPVVWVCTMQEWEAATAEKRSPAALPWPAEDVSTASRSSRVQPPAPQGPHDTTAAPALAGRGRPVFVQSYDAGMEPDGAEARARAAYQAALERIHAVAGAIRSIEFTLANPHRRWTGPQRRAVGEYAQAWTRLAAARAELETLLARPPGPAR